MKKTMKNNLLFPLIVLVIGSVAVYYFTKSSPDVRYNLSDSIPVTFSNPSGNTEIIQQLKVQNIGNETAKNIQVKIKGEVKLDKVDKYSIADEEKIFNQDGNFELLYPELPPQAGFLLTIRSQSNEINKSNLNVSYNLGLAQEAFKKKESTFFDYISIPLNILYIVLFIFLMPFYLGEIKESSLKGKTVDEILKTEKPFYLRNSKWQKIIKYLMNLKVVNDSNRKGGIKFTDSYMLLSTEKPEYIDDSDWRNLISAASNKLKEIYKSDVNNSIPSYIIELLRVPRPNKLKTEIWNELLEFANEEYLKTRLRKYFDVEDSIFELKAEKPNEISELTWNKFRNEIEKDLIKNLQHKVLIVDSPYTYLQSKDLSVLDETTANKLKREAYKNQFDDFNSVITYTEAENILSISKPEWLEKTDWEILRKRAEKIVEIDENEQTVAERMEREIKINSELREKYEVDLKSLSMDKERISKELKEIAELKQNIENQLKIIDVVITAPEKIDYIEDYSHTFAPGNFENLKKLAKLNKSNLNNS